MLLSVSLTLRYKPERNSPLQVLFTFLGGVGRDTTTVINTELISIRLHNSFLRWTEASKNALVSSDFYFLLRDESCPGVIWCQIFGISTNFDSVIFASFAMVSCTLIPLQSFWVVSHSGARIYMLSSIEMSQSELIVLEKLFNMRDTNCSEKKNKCFAFVFIFMSFAFQKSTVQYKCYCSSSSLQCALVCIFSCQRLHNCPIKVNLW